MDEIAKTLLIITVTLVLYASLFVTYHTLKSDFFEKRQKTYIICLAWLFPIIGPTFIFGVLLQDKPIRWKRGGSILLDYLFLSWIFSKAGTENEKGTFESSSSENTHIGLDVGDDS